MKSSIPQPRFFSTLSMACISSFCANRTTHQHTNALPTSPASLLSLSSLVTRKDTGADKGKNCINKQFRWWQLGNSRSPLLSTCGPDLFRNVFCPAPKFTSPNQGGCVRWTPWEIQAPSAKGPQGSTTNFSLPTLATTELLSLSFTAHLGNRPSPHPSYAGGRILFLCAPAKGCPRKRSGNEHGDNIQSWAPASHFA